jgi:DNA-binding MarR family transcriptional regulator
VSGRISCTKGNVSGLVHRLAGEGLISREPDPRDRRYNSVRITAKGRAALMAARPAFTRSARETLGTLTPGELETLAGLLQKISPRRASGGAASRRES